LELLENLVERDQFVILLDSAKAVKEQLQAALEKLPPEERIFFPNDPVPLLICGVRGAAEEIDTADDTADPKSFDWQELEYLEGSPFPLSPAEVASHKEFLSILKQTPCLFNGLWLLLGPMMRILREVTTVALGVHFALIRRDVHELLALSPALSRLLYAMADFISDHQLILDQDSRNQRRQDAKKARHAKTGKHAEFRRKVFARYLEGKEKGEWRNPHQAKKPLTALVFEEARQKNILTSIDRAETTIYDWLRADRKMGEIVRHCKET